MKFGFEVRDTLAGAVLREYYYIRLNESETDRSERVD